MALQHYQGARELVMKPETLAAVEEGVKAIRQTIQSYGFSKEAADSLNFKVTEHSLFISDEERRSGAFHTQADGQPFFAVTLTAPGSMMDITPAASATPTAVPVNQQIALLSFEIGMNLFSRVEQAMQVKFGTTPDPRAGGKAQGGRRHHPAERGEGRLIRLGIGERRVEQRAVEVEQHGGGRVRDHSYWSRKSCIRAAAMP